MIKGFCFKVLATSQITFTTFSVMFLSIKSLIQSKQADMQGSMLVTLWPISGPKWHYFSLNIYFCDFRKRKKIKQNLCEEREVIKWVKMVKSRFFAEIFFFRFCKKRREKNLKFLQPKWPNFGQIWAQMGHFWIFDKKRNRHLFSTPARSLRGKN